MREMNDTTITVKSAGPGARAGSRWICTLRGCQRVFQVVHRCVVLGDREQAARDAAERFGYDPDAVAFLCKIDDLLVYEVIR